MTRKSTILTADDDPQILRLVKRSLELEDFAVLTARDGAEALEVVEQQPVDLLLLDVMMPRVDGFTVCQKVREFSTVPIIIITARGQDQEKIKGLNMGADDYLIKPFNLEELIARVRAVLRRSQFPSYSQPLSSGNILKINALSLDEAQRQVFIDDKAIDLTPTEYRVLSYLMHNAGRVITQDLLLEHVWGSEYVGESHMLQVNINRLRRKIEPDPSHPIYILTKMGIGYQFAAPSKK